MKLKYVSRFICRPYNRSSGAFPVLAAFLKWRDALRGRAIIVAMQLTPSVSRLALISLSISIASFGAHAAAQSATAADPLELVKQGRTLFGEGKHDDAMALYRKALTVAPDLFEAHQAMGVALDLDGQYVEARKHLTKAIEVARPDAKSQALRTMAMSYAFERKCQEAAQYEQQVFDAQLATENFTGAAETANESARICLESGSVDEALRLYQSGHETALRKTDLTPAERDLWDFRWEHAQARILARRGKSEDAKKHVAAAKALLDKGGNPEQAPFYPYLAGYVAFYGADYSAALNELQKADQRDPFILSLIAQTYEKLGDRDKALEYYRKVMASNAHNPTNAFARPLAKQKLESGSMQ
jgi:tetratricopeptide (TPR) repeat protein